MNTPCKFYSFLRAVGGNWRNAILSPVIVRSAHTSEKSHALVFCLLWMSAVRSCCCLPNRSISLLAKK